MLSLYKSSLSSTNYTQQPCNFSIFSFHTVINPSLWITTEGQYLSFLSILSNSNTVFHLTAFIGSINFCNSDYFLFFHFFSHFLPILFHYSQVPELITEVTDIQLTTIFHLLSLYFLVPIIVIKNKKSVISLNLLLSEVS